MKKIGILYQDWLCPDFTETCFDILPRSEVRENYMAHRYGKSHYGNYFHTNDGVGGKYSMNTNDLGYDYIIRVKDVYII